MIKVVAFDLDGTLTQHKTKLTPENRAAHLDAEIIVNASPVGMYPHNNASPCELSLFSKCEAVFDLIYNPARTALMLEAEKLRIIAVGGISMLVAQAAKAFEHFTGDDYEDGIIESIGTCKYFTIVTTKKAEIGTYITTTIHHGFTELHGLGGFTGEDRFVLLTVCKRIEGARLRRYCKEVDPNVFSYW